MKFFSEFIGALLGGIAVLITVASAWLGMAALLYFIFEVIL